MSRTTVLQLIAAVITIAVLAVIHQGADWMFNLLGVKFAVGFMVGAAAVLLIWIYEDRQARSRAVDGSRSAEQQGARHTIDL
ncbi:MULTISPECIES: hypothetical protein [unclassified Mesorhizobium]|uniref:hypothetical protein n=1 Tax=unclassified Mesorhizobium TaxID=325217 RepID=UPI000F74F88A|nr:MULTISPECIES: hypothetical protein [unclassified Mesorhizobium]AZO51262.1 hypothetical protein EJ073_28705 [Mesorhizobium sp. M4B.F.Ca.ET.058.02.1.1]RVC43464.1 hypothetical protein EN781_18045 [Mesorhizobium sp. M4A.F.Ca.ET.090.04.2.1]